MAWQNILRFLAVLAGGALVLGTPGSAAAHAELLLASPAPGTGLAQAPAAVVIKFSEPLNISLSRIEVLDAAGVDVGHGPSVAVAGDPQAMRRPLGLLPTGQYLVRWTSVSSLDGHTLRGSYFFAVGTGASLATTIADSPLDSEGPIGLVGRFVALVALGAWLAAGLLRGASMRAGLDMAKVARPVRTAPMVAFAGTLVSLASTTIVATGSLGAIAGVLASQSGEARLIVLAATSVGVLVGTRWQPLPLLLAAIAIVADAASGHAASSILPPVAIASLSVHLAAVGIWTYAIAASLVAAPDLRRALGAFTPYAVAAGALVAGTGVVNAILELADPADLVETGYGQMIVAKSAAFVAMAGFGLLHFLWRRRPRVPDSTVRLPLRVEATAALTALVLATLLVSFPNPPREAEATAAELTTTDPLLAELGARDALSIADASGPFVVGLTILPPRPGTAEVRVQVLGVDPGDGLRNARLQGSSGPATIDVPLDGTCGLGCFTGTATFAGAGDWRFDVRIDSNRGPIDISETVPLPTPDGSARLLRALGAEESLKGALLTERLRGSLDGPTIVSDYRFEAPDKAEITTGDATTILAGEEQFRRTGSGPWESSTFPAPGFTWPTGYYREFWGAMVAPRVLGMDTVDGVPTQVLAFLRPDVPAWFRIWVRESDGLVVRQEMRAEGHLMDHSYSKLNGPITVTPPN
ncbi:MAG: copper resistance protein CopC/CopD [Chloroflexi bacterium]|nr:copper resistance protein CopC/CopD [Chloroflexota bacterium]